MEFGVFDHMDRAAQSLSGNLLAQQYEERLQLIECYEQAGFRGYHVAEHHSTPLGVSPSPLLFLTAAAQRTKRIRLGPLVLTLSMYHPLRVFEEVCMLDCLSNGRLELGIGRGISPIELGFYGIDVKEAQDIYAEVSDVVLNALKSDVINHSGKYFRFDRVPVEMKPIQVPMPLWYGAAKPETADWAAENRINVMCNGPVSMVGKIAGRYKSSFLADGNKPEEMPLIGMSRHMVVADTDEEAVELARPAYHQWYSNLVYLWKLNGLDIPLSFPEDFDVANANGFCFVGSPSTVRDRMVAQVGEAGINYLLCRLCFGNLSSAAIRNSVALIEREIMPAFASERRAA